LRGRIERAVEAARRSISTARWRLLPAAVAAAESQRIVQIVGQWIETCERPRPPFDVTRIEDRTTVTLSDVTLQLTVDRIDRLPGGGAAIIDYKAGEVGSPPQWFELRPREPQLGIYALALAAEVPQVDVEAVAYAQLKAGKIRVVGLAEDTTAWPELEDAEKLKTVAGWHGAKAWWQKRLPEIAAEVREGVATVTPRHPRIICRTCGRQPLCRIGALGFADDDEAIGEAIAQINGDG
jgi:ATP-dependent helicase/nuclease subunit B